MTAGTVTDSHRYSAMAAARLGLRLCALRKPRHAVIPGLRNNVAASSHVLRFNRIFGFGEGHGSVNTTAFLGCRSSKLSLRRINVRLGTVKKSNAAITSRWLLRKASQRFALP
jgi:hypothetical protein